MNILRFLPGEAVPGFDGGLVSSQKANEHICTSDGQARCSLWWDVVPKIKNERIGVIGHFEVGSLDAGLVILEQAAARLRERGCTLAVGPMDGNTWRRYRVVIERGLEPAFFMEPDHPDIWPAVFESAGFFPAARYSSSLVDDLSRGDPRVGRVRERMDRAGVRIRDIDPLRIEEDLRMIYQVSIVSFAGNYLYTAMSEEVFLEQYLPFKDKIRPEMVLIAERDGQAVGYLFGIPDYAEAFRGLPVRTVIAKTLAILPGRQFGGLGLLLTAMLHERAQGLGYSRVIHALEHEGKHVGNMSEYFGKIMRRYALYSRRLA